MIGQVAPAKPAQSSRLLYVDALRGLAAMTVLLHHTTTLFPRVYAELANVYPAGYAAAAFVSKLNFEAVLLFFVLSGFSIRLSTGQAGLRRVADTNVYLFRRLKRILPLFIAALALTALLGLLGGHLAAPEFSFYVLVGNLIFLQTPAGLRGMWFVPYGDNGPLWSLSYEMFYYLLFPVTVLTLARFGMKKRLVAFCCAVALSVIGIAFFNGMPCPPFAFLSLFAVWYCGVDLAEHYLAGQRDNLVTEVFLCAIAVALAASIPYVYSTTAYAWAVGFVVYVVWRVGLSLFSRARTSLKTKWMLIAFCTPFARLGQVSYAVYLFHFPLLAYAAESYGQTPFVMATSVAIVFGLAWIGEWIAARPKYGFMKLDYIRVFGSQRQ
jgi:peptidoglycan/LPS O-acetylase OafA/YrhL